jgi:flagellar hook-associated protein 1 FlgK
MKFNAGAVSNLSQADLDYLTTIQWRDDINFDGSATTATSFSKFYQKLKVNISSDKEDIDFTKETQDAVTISLSNNYDKIVKVDKDEEMVKLMEFQAAYEASAKIITVSDEMLQTILNM